MKWTGILGALITAACTAPTRPPAHVTDIAWSRSPASMSANEFLLTVTRLAFVRETRHGQATPGKVIEPEETVNRFDPMQRPAIEGQGRMLARIIDGSTVTYWWADPVAHVSLYLDPRGRVVGRGTFKYCDHNEPSARPDAAFNMIHPASWQCQIAAAGDAKRVGNSSWVSCGGGCCNGAVH